MAQEIKMQVIARVRSDFPTKFGVPRQSALVEELKSTLVFEPEFRDANALRGIEQFSHLWLIWQFSENADAGWSPTVRPPRRVRFFLCRDAAQARYAHFIRPRQTWAKVHYANWKLLEIIAKSP